MSRPDYSGSWIDEQAPITGAAYEGLTVEKLRQAKRELMRPLTNKEIVARAQYEISLSEAIGKRLAEQMDREILRSLCPTLIIEQGPVQAVPALGKYVVPFTWKFAERPSGIGIDFATKETPVTKKTKPEKFNTIGVRFPENPVKEYTYKVRIGAKPYLGQELVADTPKGQAVVFVTRIDKTPQSLPENLFTPTLKYIERKAVAL